MANYTYEELERLANAVRNAWASCYNGGFLPGMSKRIRTTGDRAFMGLQGNVIEIIGKDIFSGISLQAIIAMGVDGIEEALRIQDGYSPFDMKPGFLRSPKAKKSKEGKKYFIMSFRHTVPGGAGIAGKVMSPSVHKAAMNKMIGNQIQRGSRFSDQMGTKEDPSDFGLINSRGYEWQNGPYAGMTNIVSSKEGKKHSVYRTFRVISEKSDQDSWWHPGMESNDVIGSTVKYVTPYIAEGLKRAAKSEVINKINKIFSHPISV